MDINKESILKGIYDGRFHERKLPQALYEATADELLNAVDKGYGGTSDKKDEDMVADLEENIFMFSAAKTFHQTHEMSKARFDNGKKLAWAAFALSGGKIFDRYNEDYLNSELDTAEWAARSAGKWMQFERDGVIYLMYIAEIDNHTCTICKPLDKILIRKEDSFWDENATPQHFNCRCHVEPVKGIKNAIVNKKETSQEQIKKAIEKSQEHKNPLFNYNPGKDRVIFKNKGKGKHPYFIVPDEFKEFAATNFGLPLPKLEEYE